MFTFLRMSTRSQRHGATRHAVSDHFLADAPVPIVVSNLSSNPVDRLMARIDHYMHCELDVQYDHARPDEVRAQLREELEQELANARLAGWLLTGNASQVSANDAMLLPGARA